MSQNDQPAGGLFGLVGVAAAMAACCAGFPLLLGAGIAIGTAGTAAGSVVIVAAGTGLVIWAWRRHKNAKECDSAASVAGSAP